VRRTWAAFWRGFTSPFAGAWKVAACCGGGSEGDSVDAWKEAWSNDIAPKLPASGLRALRQELLEPTGRLCQGNVVRQDDNGRCLKACAIGFAGWEGESLDSAEDVSGFFWTVILACPPWQADFFLNWVDATPFNMVAAALVPMIDDELNSREGD
jgi:hypothetical protein